MSGPIPFYLAPKQDDFNKIPGRLSRMSASGRLLPFTNATFWFGDRPLLGESGHWDASSKSHVYDIHERLLSAKSGHSTDSPYCEACTRFVPV